MNIEDHLPLVDSVVAKFYRRGMPSFIDRDDLHGAGAMGLMDAAEKFDASKGVPFECYARLCIRREVIEELRRIGRNTDMVVADGEGKIEIAKDECCTLACDRMEMCESSAAVFSCVRRLPDREREVVSLHYFAGLSGTEISRRLGVTKQRISFLLKAAHERLRQWLSNGPDALAA